MPSFSISRFLPWLSIRSKLIIAFVGLSIIPLILVGVYSIYSNVHLMEKIALDNLTHDVQSIRENTSNFLKNIENDVRMVDNSPLLREFLSRRNAPRSLQAVGTRQRLVAEILSFMESRKIYYQLRIIDTTGDELLRIETDSTSGFHEVDANQVREGRETFYRLLTDGLQPHQIAFVAAELVDGNSARIPVISFAMPLADEFGRRKILILNAFARDLFGVIEAKPHLDIRGTVVLVNSEGRYLYHSEKKTDWNRLLATNEQANLHQEYPPEIDSLVLSGSVGTISNELGRIVSYAPLIEKEKSANGFAVGYATPLFILESVPRDFILGPVRSFAFTFAAFLGAFFIVAIGLGLVATRQFTRPIARLREGAEIISRGKYGHRIRVDTHDEIEKLAEQFNSMAFSLQSHEDEIRSHRTTLEEIVGSRTHELTEEKGKLQAILDHVPSAFLMVDNQNSIQLASAAFAEMTGLSPDEVRQKDCSVLLAEKGLCKHPTYGAVIGEGKFDTHIDRTLDRSGLERFVEHTTIPIFEAGNVASNVVIITDITKRKRLEEQLIQSEKLMATGEMAAIIAHEFRNALTSVKMILQLQHESPSLSQEEKHSLSVALDSIYRMEGIVSELLHFARPNPMEFQPAHIESVIEDCLSFVQLRIQRQRIRIVREFEEALPQFFLDKQRLKEAIVNLLLNAVQAIENNDQGHTEETIQVSSRKVVLTRTLRDFRLPEYQNKNENGGEEAGREVLLRKGTECVVISISDTGPGIDHLLLRRIFDPFFTTKPNGTGLGLPMVKRTVNAHGGVVVVKSARGKGATFDLVFPLYELLKS